jgi:H+-transporting ATPase
MGGVYYLLQDSVGFDNLMHGKSPKKNQKQRSLEDFGKAFRENRMIPLVSYPSTNLFYSRLAPTRLHPTRKILIDITSSASRTLSICAW